MDVRLADLYELIVRIIEDRLRQYQDVGQTAYSESGKASAIQRPMPISAQSNHQRTETTLEGQQVQSLSEQLTTLIALQRQLLEIVQANQQRTETLLNELLNLLWQQINAPKTGNDYRAGFTESDLGKQDSIGSAEKQKLLNSPAGVPPKQDKQKPLSSYTVMPQPDEEGEIDGGISPAPSDNWTAIKLTQPSSSEPNAKSVSAAVVEPATVIEPKEVAEPATFSEPETVVKPISSPEHHQLPDLISQVSEYMEQNLGIKVNRIQPHRPASVTSLKDAQIFVGDGFYNGQLIILAFLSQSQVSPADVTVFYNAVVRPLRSAMAEPVMGLVLGETFEPKSIMVAYILGLLLVNLKNLQAVKAGEH